jgi:ribosomal protein L34E
MTGHGRKGKRPKTVKGIAGSKTKMVSARHSKRTDAITGETLHGVAHGATLTQMRRLSKTARRPSRKFGGVLSSKNTRRVLTESGLVAAGAKRIEDVELRYRKFVEQALQGMR